LQPQNAQHPIVTSFLLPFPLQPTQFRRLGVGRALLEACDAAARLAGKASISLHVVQKDTAANQLYLSYGYTEQARDNVIGAK